MSLNRQAVGWLLIAMFIVALDQWTKYLASTQLNYGIPVEILPVFNLTLQHNTGAAFSFLADAGGWQRWFFTAVSSLVSIVLFVWLCRLPRKQPVLAASLSFILAGAVGNLWDRVALGYVVDFISVHYQGSFFPAFNIADSAITLGAAFMILDMFMNPDNHQSDKSNAESKS
ncbi:signal peptidase II [Oceanicoccus sp. KOV_DT_Chl]|uniref:signal peptidase II n=1 Tax=Oceanicoccus sp. KOV_DT_Chl TaxID=1904639 RepID=UPI000C7D64AE|nr:signal peptidase II [Oceanicoccus sp. KOV_DT_Chl]